MNSSIFIGIGIAVLLSLAAVAVTIVLVLRSTKKRPTATVAVDVPLEQWLAKWGGRMPVDTALALLRGALVQLAQAHEGSVTHGCVSPEVIVVAANGTTKLLAPTGVQPPAYAAPELAQGEAASAQSDVYAMAAVLYRMVAGQAPADADQRAQGVQVPTIDDFGASEAQAVALYNALSLNVAIRQRTAGALASALGLETISAEAIAAQPKTAAADAGTAPVSDTTAVNPVASASVRKGLSPVLLALLICAGVLGLTCIALGGSYLYFAQSYQAAGPLVGTSQDAQAMARLKGVPDWFRDTKQLRAFIAADEKLQQGDYDAAREAFAALGDFRDARDRLTDVDYQQGDAALDAGDFDQAEKLLQGLADKDYKDSADLLREVRYQQGTKALDAGDLKGAETKLQLVAGYKDADTLLDEVKYQRGKQALDAGDLATAISILQSISSYKDAASLLNDATYQQAKAYIDAKQYDQAKPLVAALVAAGYSKAQDLQSELDYQQALALYVDGKYSDAMDIFTALGDYQDAEQFILECKAGVLQQAVALYGKGSYDAAKTALDSIGDFDNSKAYQTLIAAHLASGLSHDDMQSLCNAVTALGDFEDAVAIVNSDAFIEYRLFGRWADSAGKFFEMTIDASTGGWHISYNIPWIDGKFYKIEKSILYLGSDDDGWNKVFGLGVSANNTLDVYCYKDGVTYTLVETKVKLND